ncbi:MAG: pyridoxal-phosphate dependent enzyme [Pirellulales bacterium]|nr:pyridoxal-phosphate dependent enzyme [Pirellulales bacterium]
MSEGVTFDDILAARARIAPFVHRTPVMTSAYFDRRVGASLFFKCENLQRVGAFKFRGATNAVQYLGQAEADRGVVTHSSGNHAQALAAAAGQRGIAATIVMPRGAPAVKRAAVVGYGARIVECDPTQAAREATTAQVQAHTGAVLVHPYDDPRVIAGQATAACELHEQIPGIDVVLAPVGGGGLLAGSCLATRHMCPPAEILGAEPRQADDAARSLAAGHIVPVSNPDTIADGLRTSLGRLTFPVLARELASIVCVDEAAIVEAMRLVWERMKLVIEPSAAVPVAALLSAPDRFAGRRVGVILSGGNVDLGRLPWQTGST